MVFDGTSGVLLRLVSRRRLLKLAASVLGILLAFAVYSEISKAATEETPALAAAATPTPAAGETSVTTPDPQEEEATPEPEETPTPLTFAAPGETPQIAAEVYGLDTPELRMEVFNVDGNHFKFTLYGTGDLLAHMREQLKAAKEDIDYSYRYVLQMYGQREVQLKGKIIYREPKRGEDARITKLSTELWCKNLHYKSKHPRIDENKISWLVSMQDWFQFDLEEVSGFDLTIYNAYDTRQKVTYYFDKDSVVTDTLLYTSLRKGGTLRLQVHDSNSLTVTIMDPKLRDGYKNSPDEPGAIDPFWQVKAIINAKAWVEFILEGQEGQDINGMDFYAGEYHRLKDDSNKYHATSSPVTDCRYYINGNDVVMTMTLSEGIGVNLKYLEQIAVDMNNGTVLKNNIYNIY